MSFIIKELVRLILRSTLFLCLVRYPNNAIYQFLFVWKERCHLFSKLSLTFCIFFLFVCVSVLYCCNNVWGKIYSVSIDRTRKNRRGKISSLFLFATDLLMCYFDLLQHTNSVYIMCTIQQQDAKTNKNSVRCSDGI